MITVRYLDPKLQELIEVDIDDTSINVPEYLNNLHKNYLCKDFCNGENCKIWLKISEDNYILMGIAD